MQGEQSSAANASMSTLESHSIQRRNLSSCPPKYQSSGRHRYRYSLLYGKASLTSSRLFLPDLKRHLNHFSSNIRWNLKTVFEVARNHFVKFLRNCNFR